MAKYSVNVRAIVAATCTDADASCLIPGWDIYDRDVVSRDGSGNALEIKIRCDQQIELEATSIEDAIEQAKSNASTVNIDGCVVDDVKLWCDEGIDVEEIPINEETSVPTI